ncbi:MAG: metallophosphoesterase family protein [Planctomycetota bacterium]|jgi:predicted phosphodiesterase
MIAILSDIHSNLEAFEVVLEDLRQYDIEEILCLGDVIGYGPNPRECIRLAEQFDFTLLGNHEEAVLFLAEDFNQKARQAVDWTRDQLNSKDFDPAENHILWNFLGDLRKRESRGKWLFVHGSPRVPTREYVMPRDVANREKMVDIFRLIEEACFVGHTHVPGVFTEDGHFYFAKTLQNTFTFDSNKYLINVGSVGQPRDNDNQACYITLEGNTVNWHRVSYDVEKTADKILAEPGLPDYLADRLKEGK